jgi:hypothetical protein
MPPTAIGRTTDFQIASFTASQEGLAAESCGPRKYANRGTRKPHASRPPAKFSAARRGPMMYPTPIYAGRTAGAEIDVTPPTLTGCEYPLVTRLTAVFPIWPMFTRKELLIGKTLI